MNCAFRWLARSVAHSRYAYASNPHFKHENQLLGSLVCVFSCADAGSQGGLPHSGFDAEHGRVAEDGVHCHRACTQSLQQSLHYHRACNRAVHCHRASHRACIGGQEGAREGGRERDENTDTSSRVGARQVAVYDSAARGSALREKRNGWIAQEPQGLVAQIRPKALHYC